jgi:hypothetical protein
MFQSNFQKLLQENPNLSKKAKQSTNKLPSHGPQRSYAEAKDTKFSSMGKKLDSEKLAQLNNLSKLTALNVNGQTIAPVGKRNHQIAKVLGDNGKRANRSAPARELYIPDVVAAKPTPLQLKEQEQRLKRIAKQEEHIKNYKATEWFQTKVNDISVPPLHDPIVVVHHYGLGQKHASVFNLAQVDTGIKDERDYQHVLLRVVLLTKYGQVVYDQLVEPLDKVTDYRTDITGVSRADFQMDYNAMKSTFDKKGNKSGKNDDKNAKIIYMNTKVRSANQIRNEVAEIIENRILIGYALSTSSALRELEKQALLHRFSTQSGKRNLSSNQQKELLEDYQTEQLVKNKNYLLDMLQITHPGYLIRDFAHGKIIKLDQIVINTYIVPTLSHFAQSQQQLIDRDSAASTAKEATRGGVVKDQFLSISKPLDYVSLDPLLTNAMTLLQLYYIKKGDWEGMVKHSQSVQIRQYWANIIQLSKKIEDEKELKKLEIEQNEAKMAEKARKKANWEAKQVSKGKGVSDSDDGSDSDDDSDSDNGSSRW